MKRLISTSSNINIAIDNDDLRAVPYAELIIAYMDGKNYSINDQKELSRKAKISEVRLDLSLHQIKELKEYLKTLEGMLQTVQSDVVEKIADKEGK